MSNNKEHVDGFLEVDSIEEPVLFDQVGGFNDFRHVGVAGEIVKHAKSHDSETFWCREIAILLTDILELASGVVENLHIASDVPFAIDFGKLGEGLVYNVGDIELVIANGEQIVLHIFEDGVGHSATRSRGITKASAVVQIS